MGLAKNSSPTGGDEPAASLQMVKSRSLPDQIADAIVEGIATGVLLPGQRLIELDLASQFSVSRVPLREALKTLEAQGILERGQNRGVRIVELDDSRIDKICEVRAALETIAARHAIATFRAEPARLQRLDAVLAEMEEAVQRGAWGAVNRADLAFHRENKDVPGYALVLSKSGMKLKEDPHDDSPKASNVDGDDNGGLVFNHVTVGILAGLTSSLLIGNLSQFTAAEILQMSCLSQRSGRFMFKSGRGDCEVYLQHGAVRHAVYGPLQGEAAVAEVFRWRQGRFYFEEGIISQAQTVDRPWAHLLIENLQKFDETLELAAAPSNAP